MDGLFRPKTKVSSILSVKIKFKDQVPSVGKWFDTTVGVLYALNFQSMELWALLKNIDLDLKSRRTNNDCLTT